MCCYTWMHMAWWGQYEQTWFFETLQFQNVLQPTIHCYMKLLDFLHCDQHKMKKLVYCAITKSYHKNPKTHTCDWHKMYYVAGHECEDVVKYHSKFCSWYLTIYKPHCMHWVQMPKSTCLKTYWPEMWWIYISRTRWHWNVQISCW